MNWQEELDKISLDRDHLRNDNGNMLFKHEVIPIIHSLLKQQREIIAENEGLDCPNCDNGGGYGEAIPKYRYDDNGNPIAEIGYDVKQTQCEFCHTQPGSKYRVLNSPEPGGKDE